MVLDVPEVEGTVTEIVCLLSVAALSLLGWVAAWRCLSESVSNVQGIWDSMRDGSPFAVYASHSCNLSLLVFLYADTCLVSAAANCTTLGVVTCGLVVPVFLVPEAPHQFFFEEAQLETPPQS